MGVGRRKTGTTSATGTQVPLVPATTDDAPALRITLLGSFAVSIGDRSVPPTAWKLLRARSLLKLLALAPSHQLSREQLLEHLWPDFTPETAVNNLYSTLNAARQALAPVVPLRLRGGILALDALGPVLLDVVAFAVAAEQAQRSGDPADYHAALDLYGGELLPEDRYEDWVVGRREELRETYHQLLLGLAARQRDDGDLPAAITTFQRLVAADPAHEEAHIALMRLQARLGQRARAIRQYQALRTALERDLDAEPGPEARRLYGDIVTGRIAQDGGEQRTQAAAAHQTAAAPNVALALSVRPILPIPLTSFVGRELELAAVRGLLLGDDPSRTETVPADDRAAASAPRLVTLIGIGGTGKTRLALAVARDLTDAYPAGPWFVDLAPLRDPALVVGSLAAVLGVHEARDRSPLAALIAALQDRRGLLVLDNCEHLIDAVAEVVEHLLSACSGLQILATSREALRLAGEVVWPVVPLDLPPALATVEPPVLAQLERTAAVRLFVERVRQRQPQFALSVRNVPAIVAICRRLDGLPLALELAAARTSVLSVEQIAARLDDALGLLVTRERLPTMRQQTLRATLDWSYGLLVPSEQRLLARLAIFDGGATLAAVESIVSSAGLAGEESLDILDGLAVLANQSLVQRHDADEAESRFRLLELVREYARAQLMVSGEFAALRARHAAYYLSLAEEAEAGMTSSDQARWQHRLDAEVDNLRAVLRWAVETRAISTGLRLASALVSFWTTRGAYREGQGWLDTLLAQVATDQPQQPVPNALLAKTHYAATMLTWRGGDYPAARTYADRALVLFRELGAGQDRARTLRILANIALIEGEHVAARTLLDEAEHLVRAGGDRLNLSRILNTQGEFARSVLGDYALAERYYREALVLARDGGTQENLATFLGNLGTVVLRRGDAAEALRHHREGLELRLVLGHQRGIAVCLEFAGAVAIILGRFGQAARFYGAAERLREAINSPRSSDPADEVEHQHYLAIALAQSDAAAWAADWAAGRALPLERAIADFLALAQEVAP